MVDGVDGGRDVGEAVGGRIDVDGGEPAHTGRLVGHADEQLAGLDREPRAGGAERKIDVLDAAGAFEPVEGPRGGETGRLDLVDGPDERVGEGLQALEGGRQDFVAGFQEAGQATAAETEFAAGLIGDDLDLPVDQLQRDGDRLR